MLFLFRRLSGEFPEDDVLANMAPGVEESLLSATQLVGVLNWCVPSKYEEMMGWTIFRIIAKQFDSFFVFNMDSNVFVLSLVTVQNLHIKTIVKFITRL